jgi:(2Fe-2S) ferredoxin
MTDPATPESAPAPAPAPDLAALRAVVADLGIGRASRHLLMCAMQTKPKCAPYETTEAVWRYAKQRMKELGIATPGATGPVAVLRSKVDCLRICREGPICVVYPEGTWYRGVTIPVMERILVEHLVGGRPVEEHVFARAPLGA